MHFKNGIDAKTFLTSQLQKKHVRELSIFGGSNGSNSAQQNVTAYYLIRTKPSAMIFETARRENIVTRETCYYCEHYHYLIQLNQDVSFTHMVEWFRRMQYRL